MYFLQSWLWGAFLATILVASCSIPPKSLEIRSWAASPHPNIAEADWVEDVRRAEIGSGILYPESLSPNDTLTISWLSTAEKTRFAVNAAEPIAGLTNVRAHHVENPSIVLLLTIGEGRASGRLMEPNRLFILHYDEELDRHFWLKADPDKMDILPEGEPLEGP